MNGGMRSALTLIPQGVPVTHVPKTSPDPLWLFTIRRYLS
jgi:hypothetical protein